MSVPSTSAYRSSSVGSSGGTAPYEAFIKKFLGPDSLLIDYIAHSDAGVLLGALGFGCGYEDLNNYVVDQYVDKTVLKKLEKAVGSKKYPEAVQAFRLAFMRAMVDSGKLNPILEKSLREKLDSGDPFPMKAGDIMSVKKRYESCDRSAQAAMAPPVTERMESIIDVMEVDLLSSRYYPLLDKLDVYGDSFDQSSRDPQAKGTYRQFLAIQIARTISEDFARRLGEEFVAESNPSKIKSFIEHEMRTLKTQCSQGHSSILPSAPSRAASHLTTTTNTTTTTTTTSTIPITATVPVTTTTTAAASSAATLTPMASGTPADLLTNKSGEELLVAFGYPLSVQKRHHKKWKEAAKRVQKFYKECAPQPGSHRERLMHMNPGSLKDSVDSLSVMSVSREAQQDQINRLVFEKNISPNADPALNKAIIGRSQGYAQRHPELLSGRSPVSTSTSIAMVRPDGTIVTPKVGCVSSPALGRNGAELGGYLTPDGRLDQALYLKARQEISAQIEEISSRAGHSRRIILSAAGMGEFIAGLSKEDRAAATQIAAREMARLVADLTGEGISVVYTDKDDQGDFWKEVNAQLKAPVAFVGAMPGNWVDNNDLLINSTSNFYHPGHGGNVGKSLDGQFGDTLLFDAHVLRSIFHSVGLKSEDLG